MKLQFVLGVLIAAFTLETCALRTTTMPPRAQEEDTVTIDTQSIITKESMCTCAEDQDLEIEECSLRALKKSTCKFIWKKCLPNLKGPEIQMMNTILKMLKSDSSIWFDTSFVNTIILANYLPHMNKQPNLCSFAQLINATVAWETTRNSTAMSDALDEIGITLMEYINATGNNAIKKSGCIEPITTFRNSTCYGNGTIYQIDEMWGIDNGIMPCAYENTTKMLYSSTTYLNQLMAAIATISQSSPFQEFSLRFNRHLLHKWLLYTNTSPIPPCCCTAYIEKITKSFPAFQKEINRLTYKIKLKYSAKWEGNHTHN